jgi:hypothetical protein
MTRAVWSRILLIVGVLAMLIGAVDPLEGCVVILPGSALVALAALAGGRYRKLAGVSFLLIASGVGVMVALSQVGGIGGDSGRSILWWLAIAAYPAGWILGLAGAALMFRRVTGS